MTKTSMEGKVVSPNKVQGLLELNHLKERAKIIHIDIIKGFGLRLTAKRKINDQVFACLRDFWERDTQNWLRWYYQRTAPAEYNKEWARLRKLLQDLKIPFHVKQAPASDLYSKSQTRFLESQQEQQNEQKKRKFDKSTSKSTRTDIASTADNEVFDKACCTAAFEAEKRAAKTAATAAGSEKPKSNEPIAANPSEENQTPLETET